MVASAIPEEFDEISQLKAGVLGLFDKRGIPIIRGDLVKVFHFIGARNKRHYMYKQCLGFHGIGPDGMSPYLKFGHLNFAQKGDRDEYYLMLPDGTVLDAYEIIQSVKCDHEHRDRIDLRAASPTHQPMNALDQPGSEEGGVK